MLTAFAAFVAYPASAAELSKLVNRLSDDCVRLPAETCLEIAWPYADRDGDQQLSAGELESLWSDVTGMVLTQPDSLSRRMRSGMILGLVVVKSVGMERLFVSYDINGDGGIDRDELMQDLSLDGRPLPQLLRDPEGFDRRAFSERLGGAASLLGPGLEN
jgi:hypothetical protein